MGEETWEYLKTLFDSMGDPVLVYDSDFTILDANPAALELLGFDREEVVGRKCYEASHHQEDPCTDILCPIMELINDHNLERGIVHQHYKKDGTEVTLEITASSFTMNDGKTKGVVAIMRDVTERKQVEEALLDSLYNGVTKVTPEGVVTYVNSAFCRMTGFEKEEIVGKKLPFPYWPKEEMPRIKEVFEHIVFEGKGAGEDFELTFRRKDGGQLYCLMTPTPIEKADGTITGWMAVFKDITERKWAEEEMKRRLIRFSLEDGVLYLIKEPLPALSLEAFGDLLTVGYHGVVISRTPEEEFRKAFTDGFEFLWLAEQGETVLTPSLKDVEARIADLPSKTALLMDRLDYLVFKNGFEETLSFVQRLRELAYLKGHVVILSLDPSTLNGRDLRLLEKEGREVEPMGKAKLPDALLEALKFIYRQNMRGVKPSLTEIGMKLGASRPTVRKRIGRLVCDGYVRKFAKGNKKVVELTEKGRNLLLK